MGIKTLIFALLFSNLGCERNLNDIIKERDKIITEEKLPIDCSWMCHREIKSDHIYVYRETNCSINNEYRNLEDDFKNICQKSLNDPNDPWVYIKSTLKDIIRERDEIIKNQYKNIFSCDWKCNSDYSPITHCSWKEVPSTITDLEKRFKETCNKDFADKTANMEKKKKLNQRINARNKLLEPLNINPEKCKWECTNNTFENNCPINIDAHKLSLKLQDLIKEFDNVCCNDIFDGNVCD